MFEKSKSGAWYTFLDDRELLSVPEFLGAGTGLISL